MLSSLPAGPPSGRKTSGTPPGAVTGSGRGRAVDRSRLTLVVVDDVEDTRAMYARYLQYLGIRVLTAEDGFAALDVMRTEAPDAVVLDLAMPGMTGWEAVRRLREDVRTRELAVIVVSGQGARESAIEAGADSYLEKPCLPDQLVAEVLRVLHARAARRR